MTTMTTANAAKNRGLVYNPKNPDLPKLVNDFIALTDLETRPYQIRIINKTLDAFINQGLRSVLIDAPTGAGKTSMSLTITAIMQLLKPQLTTGWVAMRRNLLAQAEKENATKKIDAAMHWISMFQKELPDTLDHHNPNASKERMLICDEAQHDAAGTMTTMHTNVRAHYLLGMSATCWRTDKAKLCFDTIIKDASLPVLMKEGYLSPYNHYQIPKWGTTEVAETYLRDPQHWGPSIMYFHRTEDCFATQHLLTHGGIRAEVVTSHSDRYEQIAMLEEDRTDVLINCMVLTEGLNVPRIKSVFCRPSCKGVTVQMCGRAFRKYKEFPYKQIVQSKRGWPFPKMAEPELQMIWKNNEWLSLKLNPKIDALNCKFLECLAMNPAEMPDYITEKKFGFRGRIKRTKVETDAG
jgi:superfamily II DNA or RNA helicase